MPESLSDTSSDHQPLQQAQSTRQGSKVGRTWVALAVFVFLLLLLLVFILQNSSPVKIHYFGANGTVGFGVAMLLAAVAGSILTLLVGSARILQLKSSNKKHEKIT
jgi:uncharacterized integral membrane protein